MNDYIRLPRSALEMVRDKDLWQLYGYLLSKADENGEWVVSLKEIYRDIGLSRQRFRTLLERLKSTTQLTTKSATKSTTITLGLSTSKRILATTKSTTQLTIKFTPPTDEEVAAYVAEKGYHFNPAEFVPFYQMRGWKMKGGEPMKDWKAGCRYWETNWKQRHGERFYYEIHPTTTRTALRGQDNRYSELERAADTVLFNAPYGKPAQNG